MPALTPVLEGSLDEVFALMDAHPNANAIWNRALEIFGEESKARSWMNTPRDLFDGRTPGVLVQTDDPAAQRRVLKILIRIDYGVFS